MDQSQQSRHPLQNPGDGAATPSLGPPTRLEAIHDLVRSGDYQVPASAIAERMLEHLLGTKPERDP